MTRDEAIKRLNKLVRFMNDYSLISFEDGDAVKLGIEGLERLKELRKLEYYGGELLPSETKE